MLVVLAISSVAFASGGTVEHGGTDIFQRTVNFLLFAGLLWYLLAKPVRASVPIPIHIAKA